MKMRELTAKACAKINIGLRITGVREDGFHELETIFQSVDLCDKIRVTANFGGIQITSNDRTVPRGPENTCYRAAHLLQKVAQSRFPFEEIGCEIHIDKKIPMGAGLGGGSSDAATTLRLLNRIWNLNFSAEQLLPFARQIGADVPFFLRPGAAIGYGIGDELEWFRPPWEFTGLIIFPGISISTKWAYRNLNLNLTNAKKYIKLEPSQVEQLFLHELPLFFKNDFESLVFGEFPELREIQIQLYRAGAVFANLSGSGSALFGLFEDEEKAKAALPLFDSHPYKKFIVRPFFEV